MVSILKELQGSPTGKTESKEITKGWRAEVRFLKRHAVGLNPCGGSEEEVVFEPRVAGRWGLAWQREGEGVL